MRRPKATFILVIMLSGFTVMTFLSSRVCADSFRIDVSESDVNWEYDVFTLEDLGVGEYAYLVSPIFCREPSGEIKILKDDKPHPDITADQTNYKVTRLPNDKLSIEIIPSRPGLSHKVREDFIEQIVDRGSTLSCNGSNLLLGTSANDWLIVHSVDGAKSAKELMDKIR